jgi:hypothetical protein
MLLRCLTGYTRQPAGTANPASGGGGSIPRRRPTSQPQRRGVRTLAVDRRTGGLYPQHPSLAGPKHPARSRLSPQQIFQSAPHVLHQGPQGFGHRGW